MPDPPRLVSSVPDHGARNVYPAPVTRSGERFSMHLAFDDVMSMTETSLVFTSPSGTVEATALWSADRRRLELSVPASPFLGRVPLPDDSPVLLDLRLLESASGARLRPFEDGASPLLEFHTSRRDALLNHACMHTYYGPFADLVLGDGPDTAPLIVETHVLHRVTTARGASGGWLALRLPPGQYRLYLGAADVVVSARPQGASAPAPVEVAATPPACDGLRGQARIVHGQEERLPLHVETHAKPLTCVLESVPD